MDAHTRRRRGTLSSSASIAYHLTSDTDEHQVTGRYVPIVVVSTQSVNSICGKTLCSKRSEGDTVKLA